MKDQEGNRQSIHPSRRTFSLSLRQVISSFVGSALCEFDLLTNFVVLFPMEVLAPGHAVEDEAARATMVHVGI